MADSPQRTSPHVMCPSRASRPHLGHVFLSIRSPPIPAVNVVTIPGVLFLPSSSHTGPLVASTLDPDNLAPVSSSTCLAPEAIDAHVLQRHVWLAAIVARLCGCFLCAGCSHLSFTPVSMPLHEHGLTFVNPGPSLTFSELRLERQIIVFACLYCCAYIRPRFAWVICRTL